jgi:hypothetical protein
MITKQDIIIENENGINIIPAGTNIEHDVENALEKILFDAKVISNTVEKNIDTMDGAQTDVDDFDVVRVIALKGTIIATCQVPISLIKQTNAYKETNDINMAITNFCKITEDETDFKSEFVAKALNKKSDNIKNDDIKTKFITEISGDAVNITTNFDVDIIVDERIIRKGKYRTGGYYPDA